jgi:thymidine phosphorylase
MKTKADSRGLAAALVAIGKASGVRTEAVITAMDAPLGRTIGNALEVGECLEVLRGGGASDLIDVSVELAARMLVLGKVAADRDDAERQVRVAIASGAGLDRFRRMVEQQCGDPRVVDDPARLPSVAERHQVKAERSGYVSTLDAALIGRASVALGAGRDRMDDPVDPAVGIVVIAKPGTPVRFGDPVLELHYRSPRRLETALALATEAIELGDAPPQARPTILDQVT